MHSGEKELSPAPNVYEEGTKSEKIEKLKRTKMNEDEATNLQKEKDLKKKKKKIKRTFIDTMGKKNETIKKRKRKRNYSHD